MDRSARGPREPGGGPSQGSPQARRVLDALRQHPGASLGELAKALGVSWATVAYHRRRLEKAGLVDATLDGPRQRLHARDPDPDSDRAACRAMLQGQTLGRLARLVHAEPGLTQEALAARLDLPLAPLRHHLQRLADAGLVAGSAPALLDRIVPTPLLDLLLGPPPEVLAESDERERRA